MFKKSYLFFWATAIRLSKTELLYQWVAYAKKYAPEFQWMGSGLVLTVCSISSVKYNLITSPSVCGRCWSIDLELK